MTAGRPAKSLQEKILSGARIREDRDADAQVANAAVDLGMPPCPRWIKGAAKKTLGRTRPETGSGRFIECSGW